jgi:hypothetical protein
MSEKNKDQKKKINDDPKDLKDHPAKHEAGHEDGAASLDHRLINAANSRSDTDVPGRTKLGRTGGEFDGQVE